MAVAADKDRIVITITKEDKEMLEQLAQVDSRSLSNYAAKVLQEHIREVRDGRKS